LKEALLFMLHSNATFNVRFGQGHREIRLRNGFGEVYPALHDELLAQVLAIGDQDRVLDIGGGSQPFARADTVTEPYLDFSGHRSGSHVRSDISYVQCFAEELPFADKAFDLAIARQVFEHTQAPDRACEEMMRVAKRGFIETPRRNYELLLGPNPSHNWFVFLAGDEIVFERRRFIRHPFRHIGLSGVPSSEEGQFLLHWEYKNLTNTQLYWENSFRYRILDDGEGFDYANPEHAAQAHLDTAICSLLHGGYYLAHRESDAREAIRLRPDWALAHNTLGVLLRKQGRHAEALAAFREASALEDREAYRHNARLSDGEHAVVVDFEDSLPMDERFFREYGRPASIDLHRLLKLPELPSL
jgi:hypothetical protein